MKKLNTNAKQFLLDKMKQELIDAINKMTIDDLRTEEMKESYGEGLRVGLMLRNEHMLTPDGITLLNDLTPESILLYNIIN
jgi:hypothetical protein